ncbi:hypothetical protein COO60DRAFT_248645 [Scenedesmus sp. NREL 46B-D3]|nr:hypothetical protein COO60DRAFT_248645 [Scenedesmus sp. NREL 46B-D3]
MTANVPRSCTQLLRVSIVICLEVCARRSSACCLTPAAAHRHPLPAAQACGPLPVGARRRSTTSCCAVSLPRAAPRYSTRRASRALCWTETHIHTPGDTRAAFHVLRVPHAACAVKQGAGVCK